MEANRKPQKLSAFEKVMKKIWSVSVFFMLFLQREVENAFYDQMSPIDVGEELFLV